MLRFLFQKSISRRILSSFAIVILVGSLLLNLPISQLPTSTANYFDHFFTAVSMVCVTGLSTQAVAATYNHFGQIICILLMQLGGLGLMSLLALILYYRGKRLSLVDRLALQESLNRNNDLEFKNFIKTLFKYTFVIEFLGAVCFSFRFVPKFGWGHGIFTAVFFAVSSFCNAGFDNLGGNSLIDYVHDPLINFTVSSLIILGGLGFSVWFDIKHQYVSYHKESHHKFRKPFWKRLGYHTKVVLSLTALILTAGTLITFFTEYSNPGTIGNFSLWDKLMTSYFQTVTMRTAGFATIDYTQARPITLLLYILQMLIGGSPGGTAGGIKTTTFMLVVLFIRSEIRAEKYANVRHHTFSKESMRKALAVFIVFVGTFLLGVGLLTITDSQVPLIHLLFEAMSALGTVGVSANLTPTLSRAGQCVLIYLMFSGRTGPITIIAGISQKKKHKPAIRYSESNLLIG